MSKLKLSIPSENFETTITLLDDEAPVTCGSIMRIMPVDGRLMHCASSGQESVIELQGEQRVRIEPENWVTNYIPGDVVYWFSQWGDMQYFKGKRINAEISFIYGRHVKLRDLNLRETSANLFGRMDSKLEEFAAISKKTRIEGVKQTLIQVLP
ncbi:MAG: DUF3830 family protein [Thaumarchaeota archaeon]|nr:DUF3830 family protein [Nitrososphaerota archaeon]